MKPLTQEQALAQVAAKGRLAQAARGRYPFRDHRTVAELDCAK